MSLSMQQAHYSIDALKNSTAISIENNTPSAKNTFDKVEMISDTAQ
jgi:hypothetical protein